MKLYFNEDIYDKYLQISLCRMWLIAEMLNKNKQRTALIKKKTIYFNLSFFPILIPN